MVQLNVTSQTTRFLSPLVKSRRYKDVIFIFSRSLVCSEETSPNVGCIESFTSRESAMYKGRIKSET